MATRPTDPAPVTGRVDAHGRLVAADADRLLDRGERPAHHDGAGDDQAGRDLLMDRQPRAA